MRPSSSAHRAHSHRLTLLALPLELLTHILSFVPPLQHPSLSLVSHAFAAAVAGVPIDLRILLTLDNTDERGTKRGRGSRPQGLDAHPTRRELWVPVSVDVADRTWVLERNVVASAKKDLARRGRHRIVSASIERIECMDMDLHVQVQLERLLHETHETTCTEITVHDPPQDFFFKVPHPEALTLIDVADLHIQLDLGAIGRYVHLRHLHLRSDGRLDRTGIVRATTLSDLTVRSDTLQTLAFDGPWLSVMLDDPLSVFRTLSTLTNLTTLLIDLDPRLHTPEKMVHLLRSLPNLVSVGRLGFVDGSFWRLLKSKELNRLRRLSLGTRKEPFENRLPVRRSTLDSFVDDLAIGILYACPRLETLDVWMAFVGLADLVLPVVRRLREGGTRSDPNLRCHVVRVAVYQAIDVGNVDASAWRVVVGRSLEVEMWSGSGEKGATRATEVVRRFGGERKERAGGEDAAAVPAVFLQSS
ncbi:hypothetical protein HKX48_008661 [Thoreauomyces humboldtii]|nr:hypothetical protein HKX48_008661 [Thoreauomyces humboldtii]